MKYVLSDHAIMRYIQRFWAPGCTEEKARKFRSTRRRWILAKIHKRLSEGVIYKPEGRLAPPRDTVYIQHHDVLFACDPKDSHKGYMVVVTCFSLTTYINNARILDAGGDKLKTDEGHDKIVQRRAFTTRRRDL